MRRGLGPRAGGIGPGADRRRPPPRRARPRPDHRARGGGGRAGRDLPRILYREVGGLSRKRHMQGIKWGGASTSRWPDKVKRDRDDRGQSNPDNDEKPVFVHAKAAPDI